MIIEAFEPFQKWSVLSIPPLRNTVVLKRKFIFKAPIDKHFNVQLAVIPQLLQHYIVVTYQPYIVLTGIVPTYV